MNGGAGSAIALPCEAELNKVLALSKGEQRCQQTPVGQTNFSWHNSGMNSAIKWVHFGQSFSKLILAIGQQNKFAEWLRDPQLLLSQFQTTQLKTTQKIIKQLEAG